VKILANREQLNNVLQAITRIVPARHTRPILVNTKIEPNTDAETPTLEFIATDLEVGLRCGLTVESIENPRSVVVPAQILAGIVREVRDEQVTIEVEAHKATLTSAKSRFELVVVEEEEYPDVPRFPEGGEGVVPLPAADLVSMIQRTVFAVATEQNRYAINGLFMKIAGKDVQMVATDGRRMARAVHKLKADSKVDLSVIVPPKMIREIEKLATGLDEDVLVACSNNQILAQVAGKTLVGRLVEGNYPKYMDVIPPATDQKLVCDKDEFNAKLRQAQLLTSEESRSVTLRLSKGKIGIEARTTERGAADLEMDVTYDGEDMEVAFDPGFIGDVIKVMPGDEFVMELGGEKKPGVVRDGDSYIYVIMPMSVRRK
jgi:DNA polymerase-3 subunit beta